MNGIWGGQNENTAIMDSSNQPQTMLQKDKGREIHLVVHLQFQVTLLSANHKFRGNGPLIFEDARPLGPALVVLVLEVGVQDQLVHRLSEVSRVPPENLIRLKVSR